MPLITSTLYEQFKFSGFLASLHYKCSVSGNAAIRSMLNHFSMVPTSRII